MYSPARTEIDRFFRGYWSGAYDGANLVIALSGYTAFFDRSADHDEDPIGGTVVAGFLSTVEQWALWEAEWNAVLEDFRVPYFHMKELKRNRWPYDAPKWADEQHQRYFASSLIATVKKWAIATIGAYMDRTIYEDAMAISDVAKVFNPYAECSRNCVLKVRNFVREDLGSNLPISYVFERGDEGVGMLMALMRRCELPDPIFKRPRRDIKNPQRDIDDPPMIQLQASDLLAWEIRRWLSVDHKDGARMRDSLQSFCEMKHIIWKQCTYKDMAQVIHSAGIPWRRPDES